MIDVKYLFNKGERFSVYRDFSEKWKDPAMPVKKGLIYEKYNCSHI